MSSSHSRLRRLLTASALAVLLAASPSAAEEADSESASPLVVTIKMDRVLTESAAGKEVARQIEALASQLRQGFRAREAELKVEEQAIAAVRSQLEEQEFRSRVQGFEQRVRQYEEDLQASGARLNEARAAAMGELRRQLAPVLQEIMVRRQAGVMLDESEIVLAARELDVTDEAIRAFDEKNEPIEVKLPPVEQPPN